MQRHEYERPYRDYLDLLDRGAAAIERADLDELETVADESMAVLVRMRRVLEEADARALAGGLAGEEAALAALGLLMQEAIRRSERNQEQIAAWKARTQESLCAARAGSVAMAGYAGAALQEGGLLHTQG